MFKLLGKGLSWWAVRQCPLNQDSVAHGSPAHLHHPTYLIDWWVPERFHCQVLSVIAKWRLFQVNAAIQCNTWIIFYGLYCFDMFWSVLISRDWPSKSGLRLQLVFEEKQSLPIIAQANATIFQAFCGINHYWLVVWNMAFIFPTGNNSSQLTNFSEGLKPPTRL